MTPLRPRALSHGGTVRAEGFILSRELGTGSTPRFERALAMVGEGAAAYRLPDDAWLIRLARPTVIRAEAAPGAPLIAIGEGHLSAAPLSESELACVPGELGPSVFWIEGGDLHQLPLSKCAPLDLSDFIALPAHRRVTLSPLSDPPTPVRSREAPPPADTRRVLGDEVPPPSEAQIAMLRSLASPAVKRRDRRGRAIVRAGAGIWSWLGRWLSALALRRRPIEWSEQSATGRGSGRPTQPVSGNAAGPLGRVWSALRSRLASLTLRSPLGAYLSRRQARYVRDMLDMFQAGDLREALRHAIPLGGGAESASPALGGFEPRVNLDIRTAPQKASSFLNFDEALHGHLEQTYRAAARRLEQEGRYREAAFVYAELLRDGAAAVALLERGGLLREAAEIAEGHDLPAGLIVRQWFLANDVTRAVDVALRNDAFADAVRRLAETDNEAADALRAVWAQRLAEAGEFVGAVKTLWPVLTARHVALEWMDRVLPAGGVSGAQMLAIAIRSSCKPLFELDAHVRRALEAEGFDAMRARAALVEGLLESGPTDGPIERYAPALCRHAFQDAADGGSPPDRQRTKRLEQLSADKLLAADHPPLQELAGSQRRGQGPLELAWRAEERGTLSIRDVGLLPDGGYALALGEGGIRLLRRDGRTRLHLDQPAEQLIMADSGHRAIALIRRGALTRLSRVDLLDARAEHWADIAIDGCARTFDGQHLFVREGQTVLCLDAQQSDVEAVWRVSDSSLDLARIARSPEQLQLLAPHPEGVMLWQYELPSLTLRKRAAHQRPVLVHDEMDLLPAVAAGRGLVHLVRDPDDGVLRLIAAEDAVTDLPARDGVVPVELHGCGSWAVVTAIGLAGSWLDVIRVADGERVFSLHAVGAKALSAAIAGQRLAVGDDLGRLATIDLEHRQLVHEHRLFV